MLLSAQCVQASCKPCCDPCFKPPFSRHTSRVKLYYFLYLTCCFQFDLGSLLPETVASDGTCLLGRNDSSSSSSGGGGGGSPGDYASLLLGSSGWMGLKHWIVKDLKTIATGMNDGYKMILYTLMHIRMFYASFQADEQQKMCAQLRSDATWASLKYLQV